MSRRTAQDFIELEFMTDSQLQEAIDLAMNDLLELTSYLEKVDDEAERQRGFTSYVPLQPILDTMNNLEGYIGKAENLMSRFDTSRRYLARADKMKEHPQFEFKQEIIQSRLNTLKRRRRPLELSSMTSEDEEQTTFIPPVLKPIHRRRG